MRGGDWWKNQGQLWEDHLKSFCHEDRWRRARQGGTDLSAQAVLSMQRGPEFDPKMIVIIVNIYWKLINHPISLNSHRKKKSEYIPCVIPAMTFFKQTQELLMRLLFESGGEINILFCSHRSCYYLVTRE